MRNINKLRYGFPFPEMLPDHPAFCAQVVFEGKGSACRITYPRHMPDKGKVQHDYRVQEIGPDWERDIAAFSNESAALQFANGLR